MFHADPCKIGQPPSSVLIKGTITLTFSSSIAVSLMQDLNMRRALNVDLSSTVPFGDDDERRSEKSERVNGKPR